MRSNPLAVDTLAGFQFASVFKSTNNSPEKRLFVAVLMNAVSELEEALTSPKRQREWALQELTTWFFSHDRKWPFSFENLCENLDLSPECIRHQISNLLSERNVPVPEIEAGTQPPSRRVERSF